MLNFCDFIQVYVFTTNDHLKGYMTKSNTCLFATELCLIPENVYGRP